MGKKSSQTSTTTNRYYGNTTTSNPYASATTNNSGTVTNLKEGTALNSIYNYVNNNIDSLLDEYLNPNLNSTTNQAKLNAFTTNLNSQAAKSLENNIINPLSNRNMVRSSQATDLYKNLSKNTTDSLSAYINELLSESQNNTAAVMNNLLNAYMQGYNVVADTQNQSLQTSAGNGSSTTYGTGNQSASLMDNSSSMASILGKVIQLIATKGSSM